MLDSLASLFRHKIRSRMCDECRGLIMRAQRVWKTVGADKYNTEIERLHLELESFNKRIAELEQSRSQSSTIEALKSSALMLSRQIDDLRSSIATEQLAGLLAK